MLLCLIRNVLRRGAVPVFAAVYERRTLKYDERGVVCAYGGVCCPECLFAGGLTGSVNCGCGGKLGSAWVSLVRIMSLSLL